MLLLIDKPKGMTSHDVVDKVRQITGERKVGHGGTLDPNATGLLIIGVTRQGTKRLGEFTKGKDKTYIASLFLGEEREGGDVEGDKIQRSNVKTQNQPSKKDVEVVLEGYVGKQKQVPPLHSAVRIKGKRAYELARKGEKFNIKPRDITIYTIELLEYDYPVLRIKVKVSSGTYIRALARDVGRELGVYAYLKELRRTQVGGYNIRDAVKLEELTPNNWKELIVE